MHEDVFFFRNQQRRPRWNGAWQHGHGAAAGMAPGRGYSKKPFGGGFPGFISIRKYQDSDNATFVNKFVLCEKVAYLES